MPDITRGERADPLSYPEKISIALPMNQFLTLLVIGVAGAIGALTRYGVNLLMNRAMGDGFPFGTLTVNVIGCFLLGCLAHWSDQHLSYQTKLILGVGFLGALTTFSTFGLETVTRIQSGHLYVAILNVALNLGLGLSAVALGVFVANVCSPGTQID